MASVSVRLWFLILALWVFDGQRTFAGPTHLLVRPQMTNQTQALSVSNPKHLWEAIEVSNENLSSKIQEWKDAGYEVEENILFEATSQGLDLRLEGFDEFFAEQWSFYNPLRDDSFNLGGGDVDLPRAHAYLRNLNKPLGHGVLFVIDSGTDSASPEFGGGRVLGGYNAFDDSNNFNDDNDHGTHVTSIAVAGFNEDQFGITGMAPDSKIYSGKALNHENQGSTQTLLETLRRGLSDLDEMAADLPRVVNMSLGSASRSQALFEEMKSADVSKTLFVASAGNNGRNNDISSFYPCNYQLPNVICVAASDYYDFRTGFSNYGAESVDLLAPGLEIYAALRGSFQGNIYEGFYGDKSGTSQAAPHVSGAALLVWAVNPNLSAVQVKEILMQSVDRLPGAEAEVLSAGRLNSYRAVLMAAGDDLSLADREESSGGGGCQLGSSHQIPVFLFLIWGMFFLVARNRLQI